MTLTLRAVSLNDHPLTQPITAHFDAQGGSIGRLDHNTLALPDPERYISRRHAVISVAGGGYQIRNVGSANAIVVRGQPLARGESAALRDHDQIRIGGYLLEVTLADAAGSGVEASTVVRGRAAVDALTTPPGSARRSDATPPPLLAPRGVPTGGSGSGAAAEFGAPLSRGNPFAGLLGESPPAAAGVPAASPAWAPPGGAAPPQPLLPDDFDPFAMPAPAAHAAAPAASAGTGVFDDLIPGAVPASIDELFGLQQPGARDPLADFMADLAPPPAQAAAAGTGAAAPLSTDPLALFGAPGAVTPVVDARLPTPADHVPELRAAFVPPSVQRPAPSAAPSVAAPSAAAPAIASDAAQRSGEARALWRAFCEGAGIELDPPQGVNPELMRAAGSVLRAAVAGTLQLMVVRATAKHELRAQLTMIQPRNNNPLKFSPDARCALEQLLQPPLRGFLAGPAAMTDAMHDLAGHAIGTLAGTRAALEGVLDRFTPQQLEAKLVGKSVLDSLLPMNRKAKLWELYLQHFDAIRNEAHDDFHSLFGRAFLAAYEQQLERLRHAEPGPRPAP